MKLNNYNFYRFLIFLCFLLLHSFSNSQCAMCRVVAESSQQHGSSIANGLNTGILYLMSFPYLLLLFGLITHYVSKHNANKLS